MPSPHAARLKLYETHLGELDQMFKDPERQGPLPAVDVVAFERDFSTEEDEEDPGWVLVTSGMSDRRMTFDAEAESNEGGLRRRAELIWYVHEPQAPHIAHLRWLAKYPFIDSTWLGFGHTVPLPEPIFERSKLTTSLLLKPIVTPEQQIAEELVVDGDAVEMLTLHLLTDDEHRLKQREGVNAILDLFDSSDYPLLLNERRGSLLRP